MQRNRSVLMGEPKEKVRKRKHRPGDRSEDRSTEGPDGDKQGIKWLPLFFLVFMFGSTILGGALWVAERLSGGGGNAPTPPKRRPRNNNPGAFNKCRAQLSEIYEEHNPEKISSVEKLCRKYAGHEEKLVNKVREKYDLFE